MIPKQQKRSVAVVSGSRASFGPILGYLGLPALDELSRLVEAYVLHEESFYLEDGSSSGIVARVVKELDEGLLISPRYDFDSKEGGTVSPLLGPFIDEGTIIAREDQQRLVALMLPIKRSKPILIPSREMTVAQWLNLSEEADKGFTKAELRLSEELKATYYASPDGAKFTNARIQQFSSSAVAMIHHFGKMRTAELQKLQKLLNPFSVEVSPPLILAYAVASAENLRGFVSTLKELRTDNRLRKLRTLFSELAEMPPAEAIKTGRTITEEFKVILGIKEQEKSQFAEMLFSVPKIFTGETFGKLLLHGPDFLEHIRIHRHLAILGKFHRFVPSVKQFYDDLARVFAPLEFHERELRAWLINPGIASSRFATGSLLRPALADEPETERAKRLKQLEKETAQSLKKVNGIIRNSRVQRQSSK